MRKNELDKFTERNCNFAQKMINSSAKGENIIITSKLLVNGGMQMGSRERIYVDVMAVHPEVTGSCHLISARFPDGRKIRFLVDCGLFQEKEYETYNESFPFKAEHIEFCIVTHNHADHIGRLPLLMKKGFFGEILATEATSKMLPLALYDCHHILQETAKRKNQKALYREEDVARALASVRPCRFQEEVQMNENVKITFFMNGHLLGAALVLVTLSYPDCDSIHLLFTGDYNDHNLFFQVAELPQWVRRLPVTIIQESTYGNMTSEKVQPCFREHILECLSQEGGTVIAPVFALGRAQEILYTLKQMQLKNDLLKEIPIYLDGKLAIRYTALFHHDGLGIDPEKKEFLPENLSYVDKNTRMSILHDTKKKIVLTTSGMGSFGAAPLWIQEYLKRKNAMIHFTGYTVEGSLGNRLQMTPQGETVEVGGMVVQKLARVLYTNEFSAHAKVDTMMQFLKQFDNLKLVLLNHGQHEVTDFFAKKITLELHAKGVGILGRSYLFRVNPYGLVKTMSTKFTC